MILFLDDEREPDDVFSFKFREMAFLPDLTDEQRDILARDYRNVTIVRSVEEAKNFIDNNDFPDMIFFDNHLGSGKLQGKHFLKWLLERNPPKFEAYFHTWDSFTRKEMQKSYSEYSKNNWENV